MKAESMSRADRTAYSPRACYEHSFISHEREELVEKLLSSEDPRLREIGRLETEFLKMRRESFRKSSRFGLTKTS